MNKFWSNRFEEFHWGHFLWAKVQFVVTTAIAFKVFGFPSWTIYFLVLFALPIIWFPGWLFKRLGLKKLFMKLQFDFLEE